MGVIYQLRMLITVRCASISSAARPSLLFLAQGAWWDGHSRPDYFTHCMYIALLLMGSSIWLA